MRNADTEDANQVTRRQGWLILTAQILAIILSLAVIYAFSQSEQQQCEWFNE